MEDPRVALNIAYIYLNTLRWVQSSTKLHCERENECEIKIGGGGGGSLEVEEDLHVLKSLCSTTILIWVLALRKLFLPYFLPSPSPPPPPLRQKQPMSRARGHRNGVCEWVRLKNLF